MPKPEQEYLVARDNREKANFWTFPAGNRCLGTVVQHLKTGDYTLVGYENTFTIERKASAGEFAGWLFQSRAEKELIRMDNFVHPYLLLEFEFEDLVTFPRNSGIPESKWPDLRVTPQFLVKAFHEMQLRHPRLRVAFVGSQALPFCSSLFKRIVDGVA